MYVYNIMIYIYIGVAGNVFVWGDPTGCPTFKSIIGNRRRFFHFQQIEVTNSILP